MTASKVTFSPLEERLAGPEASAAVSECQAVLAEMRQRLNAEAATHQPVARFQHIEACRLAVEAASEVISEVGASDSDLAPNPFHVGPDHLRNRTS